MHKTIRCNTIPDMLRYGWVVFEYRLTDQRWIGVDGAGQRWMVTDEVMDLIDWVWCEAADRVWRCAKADELSRVRVIPCPG